MLWKSCSICFLLSLASSENLSEMLVGGCAYFSAILISRLFKVAELSGGGRGGSWVPRIDEYNRFNIF